jgi:hypothetical protein
MRFHLSAWIVAVAVMIMKWMCLLPWVAISVSAQAQDSKIRGLSLLRETLAELPMKERGEYRSYSVASGGDAMSFFSAGLSNRRPLSLVLSPEHNSESVKHV